MPAPYITATNNDTIDFFTMTNYVNTVTDGLLFSLILLTIWVVAFVSSKRFKASVSWTIASFICMGLSIPMVVVNLISERWMYLFIVLLGVGLLWLQLDKRGSSP